MKLAISNIAWNKDEDSKVYNLMKKYGFKGLEIAPTRFFEKNPYDTSKEEIKNLKNEIEEKGFYFVSMQSLLFGKEDVFLFEGKEKRKNLLGYLKKSILFASELEIDTLVFGNPKNRVSNSEEDYEIAVDLFRELGEFAYKHNTNICVEANPKEYNTNFINTTEEAIKLVRDVNQKGFRLHYDLGTDIINKNNIDILKDNIDILNHVHISEPFLNSILDENINLHNRLFQILSEKQYDKWISIEMRKVSEESNIENIEKCLSYLSKISKGELNEKL